MGLWNDDFLTKKELFDFLRVYIFSFTFKGFLSKLDHLAVFKICLTIIYMCNDNHLHIHLLKEKKNFIIYHIMLFVIFQFKEIPNLPTYATLNI